MHFDILMYSRSLNCFKRKIELVLVFKFVFSHVYAPNMT